MSLDQRDLSYWDVSSKDCKAVAGTYRVDIGSSSRDIKITAEFSYQP